MLRYRHSSGWPEGRCPHGCRADTSEVERVIGGVNIGPALERGVAAVPEQPEAGRHERRDQPAAIGTRNASIATGTAEVGADDAQLCGGASPRALRSDVVDRK